MIAIYAVVNPAGQIINLVNWDGASAFNVAPNVLVLTLGNPAAQIGGTYIGGVFTAPVAGAPAQGIVFQSTPISGAVVQIPTAPQPQAKLYCVIEPAASLATLTLLLPLAPNDGDDYFLVATKTISALTLTPNSNQSVLFAPTALAAGFPAVHIVWSSQLSVFARVS